jgi:hypothetical protein
MNLKTNLTKYVLEQLGYDIDEKSIKKHQREWWFSTRNKQKGGLRLTNEGFLALTQSDIKCHRISLEKDLEYTNQQIIWLDNFIDSPWYLTNKDIYVFTERMAIQLILFSGDIKKFLFSKAESNKSRSSASAT